MILGDKQTTICGVANLRCYEEAVWKLFSIDIIDGIKDEAAKAFRMNCNCLPSCTSITYDAIFDKNKNDNNFSKKQETIMTITFADPKVVTLQRLQSHSYTDFLAVCGGLLGLFLGVSLLSIIEFAYFFTLRLFWTIRKSNVVPFQQKPPRRLFIDVSNQYVP